MFLSLSPTSDLGSRGVPLWLETFLDADTSAFMKKPTDNKSLELSA